MTRRVVDLSQPLSRESQLHPFFAPSQILRHIVHADAPEGRPSFNAELIITSNHAATHVDAIGHYLEAATPWRDAARPSVACGLRRIREYPRGHDVTPAQVESAVEAFRPGDPRRRHPALLLRPLQPHGRDARVPGRLLRDLGRGRALDGRSRREDLRRRDDLAPTSSTSRTSTRRTRRAASGASRTTRTSTTSRTCVNAAVPVRRPPAAARAGLRLADTCRGDHRGVTAAARGALQNWFQGSRSWSGGSKRGGALPGSLIRLEPIQEPGSVPAKPLARSAL